MNMAVFIGDDSLNRISDIPGEESKSRLTLFSKIKLGLSYKCPSLQRSLGEMELEYGYCKGNIEIENPIQVLQIDVCSTFVKILEQSNNPDTMIQRILKDQKLTLTCGHIQ